jgi:RHH-type proline utilization regulon transcriptional repressor/proline dehydrogenase/delta 1-pyrroline-5-carboxylate dehydrogenase
VLQLCRGRQVARPAAGAECAPAVAALLDHCLELVPGDGAAVLRAAAASYAFAWREHFGREHEPIRLLGERNLFRYRPCRNILIRAEAATTAGRLALSQGLLAARTCGVPVTVSLAAGEPAPWLREEVGVPAAVESEAELIARLGPGGFERLRVLVPIAQEVRTTAHAAGIVVFDATVVATGRLELRGYLREQVVSRVVHRYGSVMPPTPEHHS